MLLNHFIDYLKFFFFFFQQPDPSLKILQCRKDLHLKLETLTKQKHTRMVALKKLLDQEQVLCDRLKMNQYPISSTCVPSDNQLWELEKHIETLQGEQVSFFFFFSCLKVEKSRYLFFQVKSCLSLFLWESAELLD